MTTEFAGQVALITGAASGIGRATARLLAARGVSQLALVDRDEAALAAVTSELGTMDVVSVPIVADLADTSACASLVADVLQETGQIDIAVNSAATVRPSTPVVEYETSVFAEDLDVNLTAGFVIARDVARHLVSASSPGSIVFVASINAQGAGAGSSGYCASKAGVLGLMWVMAAELGVHGIRVNAVSPGPTDTPRSVKRVGEERMRKLRQEFSGAPLGRLATPDDIAEGIAYLCSDRAAYVTGHDLVIDGGLTASVYSTGSPTEPSKEDAVAVD